MSIFLQLGFLNITVSNTRPSKAVTIRTERPGVFSTVAKYKFKTFEARCISNYRWVVCGSLCTLSDRAIFSNDLHRWPCHLKSVKMHKIVQVFQCNVLLQLALRSKELYRFEPFCAAKCSNFRQSFSDIYYNYIILLIWVLTAAAKAIFNPAGTARTGSLVKMLHYLHYKTSANFCELHCTCVGRAYVSEMT